MKNSFDVTVCFDNVPKMPYEWNKHTNLKDLCLERISSNSLKDILAFEGRVDGRSGVLLLSDCKNAIVVKLDNNGKVLKRSFLDFNKCLDVCEFSFNLRETKINFVKSDKRLVYSHDLSIEKEMKDFILRSIKDSNNEDLHKYLYFLSFEEVDGYSKDKLIKSVKTASVEKSLKLYNFLIES